MGDTDHFGQAFYAALDDAYDHPDEDHRRYCARFCNVAGPGKKTFGEVNHLGMPWCDTCEGYHPDEEGYHCVAPKIG
jgi:hypothetical protein